MDDLKYNGSGYRDVTAERAIRKTDKQPQEVTDLVEIFKKLQIYKAMRSTAGSASRISTPA